MKNKHFSNADFNEVRESFVDYLIFNEGDEYLNELKTMLGIKIEFSDDGMSGCYTTEG